jgi:hypothetical protein
LPIEVDRRFLAQFFEAQFRLPTFRRVPVLGDDLVVLLLGFLGGAASFKRHRLEIRGRPPHFRRRIGVGRHRVELLFGFLEQLDGVAPLGKNQSLAFLDGVLGEPHPGVASHFGVLVLRDDRVVVLGEVLAPGGAAAGVVGCAPPGEVPPEDQKGRDDRRDGRQVGANCVGAAPQPADEVVFRKTFVELVALLQLLIARFAVHRGPFRPSWSGTSRLQGKRLIWKNT